MDFLMSIGIVGICLLIIIPWVSLIVCLFDETEIENDFKELNEILYDMYKIIEKIEKQLGDDK